MNRLLTFLAAFTILFHGTLSPAIALEERPANFIFLLDVSGSMLYKSEMVTAADGSKITLFEALRQALKQIASDHRILGANSNACVITFGTKVTELSDWPQQLDTEEKRQKLVKLIDSPDVLQADKHGDTYMGAAIALALDRANRFYKTSDKCTTTYVVMLTDGWDEPPPGGTVKTSDSAAQFVARAKEIQGKLGVQTWQALVIGLQNLPDRKAGTITAKQLASMLNGQFIDVTKQAGGTVSEKIFLSLKQIVENLKGEIRIDKRANVSLTRSSRADSAPTSSAAGDSEHRQNEDSHRPSADVSAIASGALQFGTVDGSGEASASFPVESRSCYVEQVSAVKQLAQSGQSQSSDKVLSALLQSGSVKPVSSLPAGAVTLALAQSSYNIAPQFDEHGERKYVCEPISVIAHAHSNCPAGKFAGLLGLEASAKVPASLPYVITVPGRLVSEQEKISLLVKKTGLFWTNPATATIEDSIKESAGAHSRALYKITVTPKSAQLVDQGHHKANYAVPAIDARQINGGKSKQVDFDTAKTGQQLLRLDVDIPADQVPGKYQGLLALSVTGPSEIVAPSDIPYEIVVEASPWEKVAPIAIPIFLLLGLTCALWLFFWMRTLRR